ncbi:hypothetical protein CDEST_11620 [Colletotrichum destructivum]|uniref:Uncharacterized protein n=1 Tax=Colletotrichum destructivum TaxID=34406 RepID=A0AAX4ITW9_9PEZI|nr:hypothetical protein CDEST_11620 [Colletotrichum destructivum]
MLLEGSHNGSGVGTQYIRQGVFVTTVASPQKELLVQQTPSTAILHSGLWIRRATLRSYVENTDTTRGIDLEAHSNVDECIPICLPVHGSRLPALHQPTSRQCHDNKSFFDVLKDLLREMPWFSWSNLLYCMDLRVPVGMHYVKFQLHPDGFACVSDRPEYPPESESARYRPTRNSIEPIPSHVFLSYYEQTLDFGTDPRSVLDQIVHKLDGPFSSLQPVEEGYGLEIEEGPNLFRLWILKLSSVVVSVLVGVGWSASGRDIQSGFAMTTAILLVLLAFVEGLSLLASS